MVSSILGFCRMLCLLSIWKHISNHHPSYIILITENMFSDKNLKFLVLIKKTLQSKGNFLGRTDLKAPTSNDPKRNGESCNLQNPVIKWPDRYQIDPITPNSAPAYQGCIWRVILGPNPEPRLDEVESCVYGRVKAPLAPRNPLHDISL